MATGVGVFILTVPVVTGADKPTGLFTLPMLSVESAGYSLGDVFSLPQFQVTGSGAAPLSTVRFDFPVLNISGIGYTGVLGYGTYQLPLLSLSGGIGFYGYGTFVLPVLVVANLMPGKAVGEFILPLYRFISAGHSVPIAKIFKGLAMNLANQAISTYNDYPFNSLACFDGHYYGATDNGIYLLEGDKNGETYIQSKLKSFPLDFGNNFLKRIHDVWLTYRSDGHLALFLATKEDESDRTGDLITEIAKDQIHEERIKTPKGLKGRYYILELKNLSGADFDLKQISVLIDAIRGRIR